MMYALYNGTDRGSIKNVHVVNTRHPRCSTKAFVNVGGLDYIIERETVKNENKRGQINAATSLNVYCVKSEDQVEDLAGEQRSDTEKVVKRLIGSAEDFMMTSLAAQGDTNVFIEHGSSRRAQFLSRFLDLDILARVHDMANKDANGIRSQLKAYTGLDVSFLDARREELVTAKTSLSETMSSVEHLRDELSILQQQVALNRDTIVVTRAQVDSQEVRVKTVRGNISSTERRITELGERAQRLEEKLSKAAMIKQDHDLTDLRNQLERARSVKANAVSAKHNLERETMTLNHQKKSLKILDEVPCGDAFPSCRFIKDAHQNRPLVNAQQERVVELERSVSELTAELDRLKSDDLASRVKKVEQLHEREAQLKLEATQCGFDLKKAKSDLEILNTELQQAELRLSEMKKAFSDDENAELADIRARIAGLMERIRHTDSEKVRLASLCGRLSSDIEKHEKQLHEREALSLKLKLHELISSALSKKGLPSAIVDSQLPLINEEIARILNGIVDFTITLEVDADSDTLEVYIDYGDSRRLIELGSGMEKVIASLAIRVALINVSTLPKTDMFVIDEGFGALDDAGVEACNRLLTSLKRYFRLIIVITHVDGIKDVADNVLEITKNEKDSVVRYVNS
jgi:DNA repair exonuclease SbcCD ATPase subunit